VDGDGSPDSAQGGFGEVGVGGALAGGDDDDGGVDCGAFGHGHAGLSEPPAVRIHSMKSKTTIPFATFVVASQPHRVVPHRYGLPARGCHRLVY